jgi:hypothetical protein
VEDEVEEVLQLMNVKTYQLMQKLITLISQVEIQIILIVKKKMDYVHSVVNQDIIQMKIKQHVKKIQHEVMVEEMVMKK